MIEANVKVVNSESRLSKNSLIYDKEVRLSQDDPTLKELVDQALKEFAQSGKPEEILVTTKMVWFENAS